MNDSCKIYSFVIALDKKLANGAGMTNCEICGISGLCGEDCPAYGCKDCSLKDDNDNSEFVTHEEVLL